MSLRGTMTTASAAYDDLIDSINNVYDDIVQGGGEIDKDAHPMEHGLFDNPKKVIDGPW